MGLPSRLIIFINEKILIVPFRGVLIKRTENDDAGNALLALLFTQLLELQIAINRSNMIMTDLINSSFSHIPENIE